MTNKACGMLGLCAKAGKLSSGEFACEKSIKSGKTRLCIIASDASENTAKHFSDMCSYRKIPFFVCEEEKEKLGHLIGVKDRSVVTVDDAGFAKSLRVIIEGGSK